MMESKKGTVSKFPLWKGVYGDNEFDVALRFVPFCANIYRLMFIGLGDGFFSTWGAFRRE